MQELHTREMIPAKKRFIHKFVHLFQFVPFHIGTSSLFDDMRLKGRFCSTALPIDVTLMDLFRFAVFEAPWKRVLFRSSSLTPSSMPGIFISPNTYRVIIEYDRTQFYQE